MKSGRPPLTAEVAADWLRDRLRRNAFIRPFLPPRLSPHGHEAERRTVSVAGLVQGIVLVTSPAASTILTSREFCRLSGTRYGDMFLPQVALAMAASLLGARLAQRITIKRVRIFGLTASLIAMDCCWSARSSKTDHPAAYSLLLVATAFVGLDSPRWPSRSRGYAALGIVIFGLTGLGCSALLPAWTPGDRQRHQARADVRNHPLRMMAGRRQRRDCPERYVLQGKDAMHISQSSSAGFQMNTTQVMVGAVLLGAGCLLGIAGMITGGQALFSSTRRWLRELEVPPSEVVKHKWDQTKAATTAGAQAWHSADGMHAQSRA